MTKNLKALEIQRDRLLQQLQALGDFRPGTISVNYRKCGRKNCACARPEHRGHGPQFLWNTTQGGKSRAQSLQLGPELENYHQFLRLSKELITVNEQICRVRPAEQFQNEEELEALKKTLRRRFSAKWHGK